MGTHIGEIVAKFIKEVKQRNDYQNKIEKELINFLDEESAGYIKRKEIKRDQITVYFGASSFAYDFNLKKDELLKKIQEKFPEIKEIKTKVG